MYPPRKVADERHQPNEALVEVWLGAAWLALAGFEVFASHHVARGVAAVESATSFWIMAIMTKAGLARKKRIGITVGFWAALLSADLFLGLFRNF
jgi:hypothetical protein